VVTGMYPHTAMAGAALTGCITLIELTRTIPGISIIGPLMLTLGTGHLLGLLRTGVGGRALANYNSPNSSGIESSGDNKQHERKPTSVVAFTALVQRG
jgi:hypothetical protein